MRLRRERLSGVLFVAVAAGLAGILVLFGSLKAQVRQQQQTIAALQHRSDADRQAGQEQQRLVRALQAQVVQLCAGRVGCRPLTRAPAEAGSPPSARPNASRSPAARATATATPSPAPSPSGPLPSLLPFPSRTLPVPTFLLPGHGRHLGWIHHAGLIKG